MDGLSLTAVVTVLANALGEELGDAELALLAAVLVQLGDTLATLAAQRALESER